ncbi:MAG: hypothetical protein QM736_08370 [Vicinamibacterales bacterium]
MFSRRYTVLIADRSTGVVRRLTISLRAVAFVVGGALALPVLIGLGAKWSANLEMHQLRAANSALSLENGNYRDTTGELAQQIQSLEGVIDELGSRSALDPAQANAIAKLPAVVKNRAVGGTSQTNAAISNVLSTSLISPDDTFGVLRTLLSSLETRLSSVRKGIERQEKLAAATPSIWPAKGWLTGRFGGRSDPFTGASAFHQGLDISATKGQPVYATADGKVDSASCTKVSTAISSSCVTTSASRPVTVISADSTSSVDSRSIAAT